MYPKNLHFYAENLYTCGPWRLGSSYLSCGPDAVHMLGAEPSLSGKEVQDHLALFNYLERQQRGTKTTSSLTGKFKHGLPTKMC